MERLLIGYYTISDRYLPPHLGQMSQSENPKLEPSALAGWVGPIRGSQQTEYKNRLGFSEIKQQNATHLVWATGGGMVPEKEMQLYLEKASRVNKAK